MKLITDTQYREVRETLDDFKRLCGDYVTGAPIYKRDMENAVERAVALDLVHNLDNLPPAAKNPMWYSMLQLKTNLTAARDILVKGSVLHTTLTQSIHIVEDWFRVAVPPTGPVQRFARFDRANQTPVMKIDSLSDEEMLSFQEAFKKPAEPIIDMKTTGGHMYDNRAAYYEAWAAKAMGNFSETPAAKNPSLGISPDTWAQAIGYKNWEQMKAQTERDREIQSLVPEIEKLKEIESTEDLKINCLNRVFRTVELNLPNPKFLTEYDGQPVPDNTVVVQLSWWTRTFRQFQIKRLRNTLSRKKFANKIIDNRLIIETWKTI